MLDRVHSIHFNFKRDCALHLMLTKWINDFCLDKNSTNLKWLSFASVNMSFDSNVYARNVLINRHGNHAQKVLVIWPISIVTMKITSISISNWISMKFNHGSWKIENLLRDYRILIKQSPKIAVHAISRKNSIFIF